MLRRIGLSGVVILVDALADKRFDNEKRDYLAVLATEILRACLRDGKNLPDEDRKTVATLKKYLDNMKDEGAFSRRADVAANLNAIYVALGMTERVPVTPEDRIKLSGQSKKE